MQQNDLIDRQLIRYDQFERRLDLASSRAGKDLSTEDDLMARFTALSEANRVWLSLVLNCYAWAAYDLKHHKDNSPIGAHPFLQAGTPGNATGFHVLAGIDKSYRLSSIFKLVRLDGARPVHVKSTESLPTLPKHERLIAAMLCRVDTEHDFHFMAQGSSGFWSHAQGFRQFPSLLDDNHRLITDPRNACITGKTRDRILFFAVPQEGLKINCDPEKVTKQFNTIGNIVRAPNAETANALIDAYMDEFYTQKIQNTRLANQVKSELQARFGQN